MCPFTGLLGLTAIASGFRDLFVRDVNRFFLVAAHNPGFTRESGASFLPRYG